MKTNPILSSTPSTDEEIIVVTIPDDQLINQKRRRNRTDNDDELPPITLNQKLLYMTYGMLSVLILLNVLKFCGWWPFKLNLEVLTPPDIDVEFSSLPKMVNAKHVVVNDNGAGEALFRAGSPLEKLGLSDDIFDFED